MIEFDGHSYFDDRLYVSYLCKGTVRIDPDDGVATTTIYHEQTPADHIWCVVTHRNCNRYPIFSIDSFYKKDSAMSYLKIIEPKTPLISLNGNSPHHPKTYEEYSAWKESNNLKDYDYRSIFTLGGIDPREMIMQTKEQFDGIR